MKRERLFLLIAVFTFTVLFTIGCSNDNGDDSEGVERGDTANPVGDTETPDKTVNGSDDETTDTPVATDSGNTATDSETPAVDEENPVTDEEVSDDSNPVVADGYTCDALLYCRNACPEGDDNCLTTCESNTSESAKVEFNALIECYQSNCGDAEDANECVQQSCGSELDACYFHEAGDYPAVGADCSNEGTIAHNLMYHDTELEFHQLADYYQTKKAILVVVSATSCPNCRDEAADLPEIVNTIGADKVAVLEVIFGSDGYMAGLDDIRTWDNQYGGTFTGLVSTGDALFNYLAAYQDSIPTPLNFIIDGDTMEVVKKIEGYEKSVITSSLTTVAND